MPARLADGLGPESDRTDGSPPVFAPSPDHSLTNLRGIGFPALTRRKASQLRLQTRRLIAQNWALCQRDHRKVSVVQGNPFEKPSVADSRSKVKARRCGTSNIERETWIRPYFPSAAEGSRYL